MEIINDVEFLEIEKLLDEAFEKIKANFADRHCDPFEKRSIQVDIDFVPDKKMGNRIFVSPSYKLKLPKRLSETFTTYYEQGQLYFQSLKDEPIHVAQ